MPDLPPAMEDLEGMVGDFEKILNVTYIGESTMAGVGTSTHKLGLAGRVSEKLAKNYQKIVQWKVDGRVGYTKKMLIDEVLPDLNCKHSDLIIIAIGGNDSFVLTSPNKWYYLTRKLIDKMLDMAPNARICFASLPPTHQFPSFNKAMRGFIGKQTNLLRTSLIKTIAKYGEEVTFVDKPVNFIEYCERGPEGTTLADLFSDGYHPSAITYDIWSEDIVEHISKMYRQL
jgi:lysophospholipase L1-like esterase